MPTLELPPPLDTLPTPEQNAAIRFAGLIGQDYIKQAVPDLESYGMFIRRMPDPYLAKEAPVPDNLEPFDIVVEPHVEPGVDPAMVAVIQYKRIPFEWNGHPYHILINVLVKPNTAVRY